MTSCRRCTLAPSVAPRCCPRTVGSFAFVPFEIFVLISAAVTSPPDCLPFAGAVTLNAAERVLFGSRLATIQSAVREDFRSKTAPSLFGSVGGSPGSRSASGDDVVLFFPGAGGPDSLTAELELSLRGWDVEAGLTSPR
eukprot:CAMPEP_0183322482 /NCGR_PEP_ID=MMETSP0160_2-20130417/71758_1 /TAXON_ID=2839 ORGANISM="Odontella Sinensis, Strain Grunow 1884" /NCGR_SAMPLE_ID=MMETSP0160_2 /ASSEMBLY_ACC=CAM_ASM_000250 /LENGTH=138 /DNA_ID=CAMNT_0025489655 /DNA_START=59 /DNA_END=472 /DNA_ORIENTATION=-